MDNRYGLIRLDSGVSRSLRDGDFEEEDVWDVLEDRKDSTFNPGRSREPSISIPRNPPAVARMIPRATLSGNSTGGSSGSSSHEAQVVPQSAPINIPDWSKIFRNKSEKALFSTDNTWLDNNSGDDDDSYDNGDVHKYGDSDDDEDYRNGYNLKLPPHELIARRVSRSQISSFSVVEGVGRTLKGRDLRKVRNAVLTQTGFLEPP